MISLSLVSVVLEMLPHYHNTAVIWYLLRGWAHYHYPHFCPFSNLTQATATLHLQSGHITGSSVGASQFKLSVAQLQHNIKVSNILRCCSGHTENHTCRAASGALIPVDHGTVIPAVWQFSCWKHLHKWNWCKNTAVPTLTYQSVNDD